MVSTKHTIEIIHAGGVLRVRRDHVHLLADLLVDAAEREPDQ